MEVGHIFCMDVVQDEQGICSKVLGEIAAHVVEIIFFVSGGDDLNCLIDEYEYTFAAAHGNLVHFGCEKLTRTSVAHDRGLWCALGVGVRDGCEAQKCDQEEKYFWSGFHTGGIEQMGGPFIAELGR